MLHIVLFSRGAQSAYTAFLVAKKYGKENLVLLHTPTFTEHPDSDRFGNDFSDFLGVPITEISCGKSLWDLIEENKFIPNHRVALCTKHLKVNVSQKYFKSLNCDFIVYLGYSNSEKHRAERFIKNNPNIKAKFPLIEKNISDEQAKRGVQKLGLKLPESYLYFEHNNCIPCIKGGKNYWLQVLKYFPEQYWRMSGLEKKFKHTLFKDISLEELARRSL